MVVKLLDLSQKEQQEAMQRFAAEVTRSDEVCKGYSGSLRSRAWLMVYKNYLCFNIKVIKSSSTLSIFSNLQFAC